MEKKMSRFPFSHVFGFLLSLVLTFAAAGIALNLKTTLSFKTIMWMIGSLAVIQAAIQLLMFMHMNEGEDGKINQVNIIYGIFVALVIVVGSIWVMTSGHAAH